MTGRLWGLCRWRLAREPPSAEAGDDLGHRMASGEGDCGRQIRAAEVVPVLASDPAACRIGALTANGTVPAGAIRVQGRKRGAAGLQAQHQVSSPEDGRQGDGRARAPTMDMA